jgi:transcriptional regulator with XRE-family HTH domain
MPRRTPIRHDPIVAEFAEKLRQVRRTHGMTQRDLARAAHLTESYVSRLENGTIAPGIDLIARLARAFGVTVGEFLSFGNSSDTTSRAVAADQAKRSLDAILRSLDPSFVFLTAQVLALVAEAVERQR